MRTHHLFLLSLTICLSLSIQSLVLASNLIKQTCKQTLDYDFCFKTLSSDPDSHKADLKGLGSISLKLASKQAVNTSAYISSLLDNTENASLQQCLSDCSENYMDAVDQLDDSTAALDLKAYDDVNAWVTAAMSDAESCNDGLQQQKGEDNILAKRNEEFGKLCGITLAITKILSN